MLKRVHEFTDYASLYEYAESIPDEEAAVYVKYYLNQTYWITNASDLSTLMRVTLKYIERDIQNVYKTVIQNTWGKTLSERMAA